MRRPLPLLSILAVAACVAACGGSRPAAHPAAPQLVGTVKAKPSGQLMYEVRLPSGRVVVQAHSPRLAEPSKHLLQLTRPATGVATAEQYDSVTTSTLPRSARYVAGYVDGLWPTYWQMRGHWPVVVGISVRRGDGADCFDMEPGNPPPSAAGPWARWQLGQGNSRPCEYSMLSWMGAIRLDLAQWGIPVCASATQDRCVRLWDANWTYARHLDSAFACTQWTDHSGGLNLDESTCATWFYKRVVPPPPPHWTYRQAFQTGFQRGFTVAYLDRRHRPVPPFNAHVPGASWPVVSYGFQRGFAVGERR